MSRVAQRVKPVTPLAKETRQTSASEVPKALEAAVGLYQNRLWAGWALGVLVAGGALVVFLVSRLIGLPGYEEHVGMWLGDSPAEYLGLPSLVIEACFVAVAAVAMPRF